MRDRNRKWIVALGLLVCVALVLSVGAGCCMKKKPVETRPPAPVTPPPPPPPAQQPLSPPRGPVSPLALAPVYFDYDKAELRKDTIDTLTQHAPKLKEVTGTIIIEGHCDERGTIEYNYLLGQRRADAVKKFLVNSGIPASKLSTVSFGEERPAAQGHDESAWSKNRRAEFKAAQ